MKSVVFNCKQCNHLYEVSSELSGKPAKCKECNAITVIPQPSAEPIKKKQPSQMIQCNYCNGKTPKGATICQFCENDLSSKPAKPKKSTKRINSIQLSQFEYAGFWFRVLATLIDSIAYVVLAMFGYFVSAFFAGMIAGITDGPVEYWNRDTYEGIEILTIILSWFFVSLFQWLYKACMESSSKQGTIGKIVLGLKVVKSDGTKLSFGRASGRYFLMNFFSCLGIVGLVSFCMAGWTEKKQTLHDMATGTIVIK